MFYRTVGLLLLTLGASHVSALTGTNNLSCSTVDEDGYRHFPDYAVDKHQLSGATLLTLRQALHIYSLTPDCSGTIVGADFCFYYQNVSSFVRSRVVFNFYQFRRIAGDNFVPKNDFNTEVEVFHAFPIDRTSCTPADSQQEDLLCCSRMTFIGSSPIPLTKGEELIFTILAGNDQDYYPLLQYSAARSEYQIRTFKVNIGTLPPGSNVLDLVLGPSNTKEELATFPTLGFVVEPDEDDTQSTTTENTPAPSDQHILIGSFSAIVASLVIASTILLIGLAVVIKLYCKQKQSAGKKPNTAPYKEYTNRLNGTLNKEQDDLYQNNVRPTPHASRQPHQPPQGRFPKEMFREDIINSSPDVQQQRKHSASSSQNLIVMSKYHQ